MILIVSGGGKKITIEKERKDTNAVVLKLDCRLESTKEVLNNLMPRDARPLISEPLGMGTGKLYFSEFSS